MAILDDMPRGLAASLAEPPSPGDRNVWLYKVASNARHLASSQKVREFLHECVRRYGWADRDFSPEIERALQRVYDRPASTPTSHRVPMPEPLPDVRLNAIAHRFYDHVPFDETSGENVITTQEALRWLYRDADYVCTAKGKGGAHTAPLLKSLHYAHTLEFIVANPMWYTTGRNQEGEMSRRCHRSAANERGRRYMVVEFDQGSLERQAALLAALHSEAHPLVMVVFSGGKSLHGWFFVQDLPPPKPLQFFQAAARLGCDTSLWDRAKLVRMPGGIRNNQTLQPILYADTKRNLGNS